jgi:ubiquinone/menaquinone biosynthesis C-methylase UbiE
MTAPTTGGPAYSLERTPAEYARLRAQSRQWQAATERALDLVGVPVGGACLDAGCGPGETMRLFAERVGPTGTVVGIYSDAALGPLVEEFLHGAGHHGCRFRSGDLTADEPLPGGPYDLVFARLLLFHLPQRVEVLRRLWAAVAPGGVLLVQDYDFRAGEIDPATDSVARAFDLITDAFVARGCDTRVGLHMRQLFLQAGIGPADGNDHAGAIDGFGSAGPMLALVLRGVATTAVAHGLATADQIDEVLADLTGDAARYPDRTLVWPAMIATWKRKP